MSAKSEQLNISDPSGHLSDNDKTVQDSTTSPLTHEKGTNYISGWRLHTQTLGLCLGIFLVNFEISIVSTSLVAITDDLKGFGQSSWVVTAYLLTYTSFMIIIAKLSDVFGRKTLLLTSMVIFTVFSGGCAAAQSMIQLIVCRAFQGVGGSGVYSLVMIIIFEMVPPSRWPFYAILVTALFALAMVLGPIFGGLINLNSNKTWIWVFLLNVPGGALTLLLLGVSMPKNFPNHGSTVKVSSNSILRVDFVGALLLLAAMTLHITGLEQAANSHAWASATVLAPLIISVFLWIGFAVSQWWTSKGNSPQEPIFPWRFVQNRIFIGLIANTFLVGAISTTCIIQIPLRFQTANGTSPLQAGIRLIPLSITIQLVIGCVLMSRGNPESPEWRALYGFEALTGFCVGMVIGVVTLMTPYTTAKRDHATATSSIVQFRFLGGATALAIVTAVSNTWLRRNLALLLDPPQVMMIFRATDFIDDLPLDVQPVIRGLFVKSFNLQMRILIGFAAAQFPFSLLLWKKEQIKLD
ncbi:drug resistance transporter [Periconia macrospinosa]|uniref:Drug resistance transporter n=1 Tax=Periconia macrospinosa TaxID=97972 RepID=A0A2V1DFH4_9PLEO|nr:drug resistance transporter [Periconia macrospinosa]